MTRNTVFRLFLALALVFTSNINARNVFPKVILSGDYPDPSVLRDGDDYYMTHSPFYYAPGFLIWHSKDLMTWEPVCRAMAEWKGSAMAPDLVKVGDTYYIYYPAEGTNWVISAKSIKGPWSAPVDLKIRGIDPGHIVTPEGKRWLFTSEGYATPLADDGMSRDGESVKVYDGWKYPSDWKTECMCLESPKLTYRNGYYYLTSAQGGTAGPATSHMVTVARSRNIKGPWENSPYNPVVHTWSAQEEWWSKGHGTLVEGKDGQWWLVYHAYGKDAYPLGRQTLIEPVEWTDGGWYRPVPDYSGKGFAADLIMPDQSDGFASSLLGWQWMGWKENLSANVKVGKGSMTMPGKGASPENARLALITAQHDNYAIQSEVVVGKGNKAGVVLFYNEKAYAGLVSDGKKFYLYEKAGEGVSLDAPQGVKAGRFYVRLENHSNSVDIMLSADGKNWKMAKEGLDVSGMHHNNYHGFFALRPGLCSAGKGVARFSKFKAEKLETRLSDKKMAGYVMVYHKDEDHGLHMAYSWDGYRWTALNDDKPVMAGDTIAEQKGIRDPYIFRSADGGFCVAMTDLHVFGQRDGIRDTRWERPDVYGWGNNRGLVLLKSFDLINWNRTNLDFTKLTCGDSIIKDWKDVGCVWAPEMNWDEERKQIMLHFTTRYKNGRNLIYYVYMNNDFTEMTDTPKFLFGSSRDSNGNFKAPTIDSDITKVGDTYHMLMVQFGYIKHAKSKSLTGPYVQDDDYFDGEKDRHEAPCAWQRIGSDGYVIMYDNYSRNPHNFGFVETKDFKTYNPVGYFDELGKDMWRTNFSAQKHGGIVTVTRDELEMLINHWE